MMVHCYLLIVSMVILWCLFSDVGTAVKIDIDPPTIPEVPVSNTSTVTFLCTADAQEDSAGRVSSIQLLRKGGQVLALAKPDIVSSFLYNEDDYYDVTAIGHIRLSEQDAEGSYLNLTLRNPEKEDGGTYACHVAFNKSESGNAIVNKAKGFLSVDKPEVKGVGEKVAELEKTIGREDEKITKVGKEKKTRESNTFQLVEKTKRQDKDIKSVTRDEKKVEDKFGKMKENTNKRLKAVKELSQKNEAEVKSLKGSVNKLAERYKRDEDELKEIGEKETGDHWRVKDLAMKAGRRTVEIKDLMAKETKLGETVNEIEMNIRNSLKKMKEISWTKSDSIAKLSVLVPKSTVHEPDFERLEKKTNELMVAITELEERLEKGVQDLLSMTTPEEEPIETTIASTTPTPSNEDNSDSNSDSDSSSDSDSNSDSDSDSKSDSDSMVAFAATNQDTPIKVKKRMTLVFSDYILKTKFNAYNEKNGVFLAPVDGLYHFSLIIKVDCVSCHVVTDIVVNKKTMVLRLKTGVMFDDKQNSASSVVQLRRNDQVKVVVVSTTEAAQVTLSTNRTCVFSGHLVTPFW